MKTAFTLFNICLFSYSSFAQPGTLDSSFGTNGKVISFYLSGYFFPYDAAIQQDGKLLVSGNGSLTIDDGITGGMSVSRYNADGTIDSSFGNTGRIEHDFKNFYNTNFNPLTIQKDKKIVLAGSGADNPFKSLEYDSVLLTRLKPDGTLDSSFGINGDVITSVKSKNDGPLIRDVIVQPDGKILVAGSRGPDFLILRYTPAGKLDMSFGGTGFIYTDFTQGIAYITSITLQPDGKIIAAGKAGEWAALARYLPDGTLDESFGKNGKALETFNADFPYFTSVILNKDGSILTAGVLGGFESSMLVAKFTTEGKLDKSFSTDGSILLNTENLQSKAVNILLQDDDKIIVTGSAFDNLKINKEVWVLWRLLANGIIDSTFGKSGQTITDFGEEYGESPFASFLFNGKVITVGAAGNGVDGKIATLLARYNNDDENKRQIIIKKIKHYISTHNNAQATSLNNVSIYPNPAQNVLHVAGLSSNKTTLTVVDFMGNVKLQAVVNTSSYNLNIAALKQGNYLLKIEINDAVVTKKFIKE